MSIPQYQEASVYTGTTVDGEIVRTQQIPTPTINDDELLIKSHAWAANPADNMSIEHHHSEEGNVCGCDVSGVVVQVGANVSGFEVGDHVSALQRAGNTKNPYSGTFTEYVKVIPRVTIKYGSLTHSTVKSGEVLPGKIDTFEAAASVTASIATSGMISHYLGLDLDKTRQAGKTLLIWGASTSTGLIMLQVASKMFGVKVIATASPKNFDILKQFGAEEVFDYNDPEVVKKIKDYAGESLVYGVDTISNANSYNSLYQALADKADAVIDNLLFLGEKDLTVPKKENVKFSPGTAAYFLLGLPQDYGGFVVNSPPEIVEFQEGFLPIITKALNDGVIEHIPLTILEGGLDAVNEALSLLRNKKVSASKIVFSAQK